MNITAAHIVQKNTSWEGKPTANFDIAVTMLTQVFGVVFLLILFASLRPPSSRAFARETNTVAQGPASYLESGAPIMLLHNASLPVDVRCHAGLLDSTGAVAAAANSRSPRHTLKPADRWSINLGPGSEDPHFCTFRSALRKWNCDERWLIKDACLWEKPRASIMPGHANANVPQPNPPCPRCDSRNSVGKPICVWTIQDDGDSVQQWDPDKEDRAHLAHPWREDDPAFYDPTGPFRFSVTKHFNHTVKIHCDVVSEAVFVEGAKPGGPNPNWDYEIHPLMDADHTYFTWTCDFEVLGTELRRGGVHIWSPQPEVNTWIRTPDCIDCAWMLDGAGLWLDDRSCYTDSPVWIREHGWDYIPNATATDDIDWSPYYYPLTCITSIRL